MGKKAIYRVLIGISLLTFSPSLSEQLAIRVSATESVHKNFTASKGTFTAGDTINVRRYPDTQSGEVVAVYESGESVDYDLIGTVNGRHWISYIGSSGNRNYMAVAMEGENPWGSFKGGNPFISSVKKKH